jgi:hypothetical protein
MLREGEMSIFEPLKKEREIKTLTLGDLLPLYAPEFG